MDIVLTVNNKHIEQCGLPPKLETSPETYTAYFENEHGEQLVFQHKWSDPEATLWHGDAGWQEPHKIRIDSQEFPQPDLILSPEEYIWLCLACVMAARRHPK
jgi:hypothetical protein